MALPERVPLRAAVSPRNFLTTSIPGVNQVAVRGPLSRPGGCRGPEYAEFPSCPESHTKLLRTVAMGLLGLLAVGASTRAYAPSNATTLADEYHLGTTGFMGGTAANPQYFAARSNKQDSLVAYVDRFRPGRRVLVSHLGVDAAVLGALVDMNDGGLAAMSRNRRGELDGVTSERCSQALADHQVTPITFRQLIEKRGLLAMRRPGG